MSDLPYDPRQGDVAPIIYVGHPIDHCHEDQITDTVEHLRTLIRSAGMTAYLPARAWDVAGAPRKEIWQVQMAALGRSDALIAYLPDGIDTVGVPMEIERAVQLGIPVAIIGGAKIKKSWAIAGYTHTDRITTWASMAMAVNWTRGQIIASKDRLARARRAKVTGSGPTPTKSYADDVGWDLYYSGPEPFAIGVNEAADVPAGIRIEWPEGMWAMIMGRSSTFKRGLLCNPAIIDPGYRGEYFAVLHNIGHSLQVIDPGDRIAQAIPLHAPPGITMQRVGRLSTTERGENGFGSSGR